MSARGAVGVSTALGSVNYTARGSNASLLGSGVQIGDGTVVTVRPGGSESLSATLGVGTSTAAVSGRVTAGPLTVSANTQMIATGSLRGVGSVSISRAGVALAAEGLPNVTADGLPIRYDIPRLYHYTDGAGLDGILGSKSLNPSLKAVNPNDARYGDGQYFRYCTRN